MTIKWLLLIACVAMPANAANQRIDALTAKIDMSDAHRFAQLFKESDGKLTAEQLQKQYLDGSSRGVEIFTPYLIQNAENLAKAVAAEPERYRHAIDTCLPVAESLNSDLRAIYLAYQGLLPEKPLPAVYFVFGAGNSGGTAKPDAQVIGLEVMCGPGTSAEAFRNVMLGMFAHETAHSWQQTELQPAMNADPLLLATLREGIADYLALTVTGKVPGTERNAWAQTREAELWRQFNADRAIVKANRKGDWEYTEVGLKTIKRWVWNYQIAPEGWPHEVGYWVGMKICAAYVDRATDKRAAIRELIELKDPAAILAASGYTGGI
jgi:Predicted Zn-dependent protease (DUF2268)